MLVSHLNNNVLTMQQTINRTTIRNRLVMLAVGVLALYVILPQISGFEQSFAVVKSADLLLVAWAITFSLLTFIAAAATYWVLALHPLIYWRTVLAQMAAMFINRLLPAGIGGIGANYVYLRKARHSLPEAASVVTANNLIGLTGHLFITAILSVIFYDQLPQLAPDSLQRNAAFLGAVIILTALCVGFAFTFRGRLLTKLIAIATQLVAFRRRPKKIMIALGTSITMTLCNVICLWFCAQALGADFSIVQALLVFTLGVIVGTATPTPGGLGGVEAGLVAGMLAYGVPSHVALAIALTYRFITYWFSMAIGAVAFTVCRRKKYM